MLFGNTIGDILTGWLLGLLSWISMLFYGLNLYDLIWEFKNAGNGMNEQQKVTKFYQFLTILIHGLFGISLSFVLRFQLWIGPESDIAQSTALLPYIRPFFGKIMFIANAALLCMFTTIQLPFILAQFGFFQQQHRRGKHHHFLFALPSIVLPLALCLFLSQMEIPDLRNYTWMFHDCNLMQSFKTSDYSAEMNDLFSAYIGNKEFNDLASLMFLPENVTLKNDTKFRLQQALGQLLNQSAGEEKNFNNNLRAYFHKTTLNQINQSIPIWKPSLINPNAFLLLTIPIGILLFLSICAFVSLAFLLVNMKRRRTAFMKDMNLKLSEIDESLYQEIQELDKQIKTAVLNVVQVSILILLLYFPLLNGIIYVFLMVFAQKQLANSNELISLADYTDKSNGNSLIINSNNLTNLLVALFIIAPLMNFLFSTTSRQQKLKIWIKNCFFNVWKKWELKLPAKPFIVIAVALLLSTLIYLCYLIGTVSKSLPKIGCNDTMFEARKDMRLNPLTYWAFLLVNLLFTHSMIKFAWNQIGVLTILNFHFGELLRVLFYAYVNIPWCGPFRPVEYGFGLAFVSLVDSYIYQFMHSVIHCMDWTPLLIALHRFHIIMVPIQANHFWSKKRIIKACIIFWMVMSVPAINNLYNDLAPAPGKELVINKIFGFLESKTSLITNEENLDSKSNRFIFICFLYAIMFCKFTWEELFSTSVQILSSSDQLHETRSEMFRITMACFLAYWLPRYVEQRTEEFATHIFSIKIVDYFLTTLANTKFIVEAISLMCLSRQYRKLVFADLQLLPWLASKLWKRMGFSRNQIQQIPQNNNNVHGSNQMANGWVRNLETTL